VKRSGRDEPVGVVIHMCMEAMLGIFRYRYFGLSLAKMLCLSYYLVYYLFNKIGEEGRTGSA
jgi:bacteriorhodopsin